MTRWCQAILVVLLSLGTMAAHAQACTTTLNPGDNITTTVAAATSGVAVICLNPGDYSPPVGSFPNNGAFAIGNNVIVRGMGATPASVTLTANLGVDYAIYFTNYQNNGKVASGATLMNLTLQGANGGVEIFNFINFPPGRLNNITLKDLVITTIPAGTQFGVLLHDADKINVDNVTVTSKQSGIYVLNANDSLIMNSTVTSTTAEGAIGLAVLGGTRNVIVNNTIGSPKVGATYSFNGGGVVFYNTTANRFENNTVQGMRDDGLDFTATDLTASGIATVQSNDNYVGKNNVISTGFVDNQPGGSGIWSNCGSNGTWMYANDSHGSVECGLCVWMARSNMVLGNLLHDNGIAGVVVSGGNEAKPFCTVNGGAFQLKPTFNFLQGNSAYFNKNDQLFLRDADTTEIASNYTSPRNGFGGPLRADCITSFCQSFLSYDTDSNAANSNGGRIVANINNENIRGFQSDDGKTIGLEFAYNRMIQPNPSSFNRYNLASGLTNWDGGPMTGGNYWTLFASANGNPGTNSFGTSGSANAHLGVFDGLSNTTGRIVDRYPYQSENLGRTANVSVFEPRSGASVAQGTRRTVRWYGQACVVVDISLDGSTALATNIGNNGYAIVTIPGGTSIGAHTISVACKNSAGTVLGSGTSPSFSVSASTLQLVTPGRDDVFDASSQIVVGWKKTAAIASVAIDLSTDGGATFPTSLGSGFTGTSARVTLPAIASTAYAVIRVRSGTTMDYTDGVFAIRGGSGAGIANVAPGRTLVMGQLERLEWASPQTSRYVDITATVGGTTKTVALNLPDRGNFDWIVPEIGAGTLSLQITFKQTSGGVAITGSINANGNTVYPTTTQPPNPARLTNISTRMQVLSGNDVLIGGFVIGGSAAKTVVVRARGPSLIPFGINNALADPALQLVRSSDQVTIASNDNWQSASNSAAITNSGFAPSNALESAILINLAPGAYTAIVSGMNGSTGVGIVEVFEVDAPSVPLTNISTRGQVLTGNDVMIGGFVVTGTGPQTVVVRARGPSLIPFGINNALADPTLQLVRSSDQVTIATNDNWQSASNASAITASGFAPSNSLESAILITLNPGAYTAIVTGVGGGTGVGIVEVFTTP